MDTCDVSTNEAKQNPSNEYVVKNFSIEYLESLHDCNWAIFPVKYSANFYKNIADNKVGCKVVLKDGKVIANASYRFDFTRKNMYLMTFGCLMEYRCHGIGTLLMKSIDEELSMHDTIQSVCLHVQCNNRIALKFYVKFGFFIRNVERNYYSHIEPPDAFYLIKYNPKHLNISFFENQTSAVGYRDITTKFVQHIINFPHLLDKNPSYNSTIDSLQKQLSVICDTESNL